VIKKSKIYTKTGDKGETSLVSGNRIIKSDLRIDLYGELDELNSRIGFLCSLLGKRKYKKQIVFLHKIQSALFDLGSNLACEFENRAKFKLPQLSAKLIQEMESEIDLMDEQLEPLKNFILPGGALIPASAHLARTSARSVERKCVHYEHMTREQLPDLTIAFLNRLSDYFFVLARFLNKQEKSQEIVWKPFN
jgi:cob(I)alamin adenosyltransferase